MANILYFASLARVDGVTIKLDTSKECDIYVTYNGNTYPFRECDNGQYFYDTDTPTTPFPPISGSEPTLASQATLVPVLAHTVEGNKTYFAKEEIEGAEEACRLQQHIGWPSTTTFKKIVAQNMLCNCPITTNDIDRAEAIFGKPKPLCKGKMTQLSTTKLKIQ